MGGRRSCPYLMHGIHEVGIYSGLEVSIVDCGVNRPAVCLNWYMSGVSPVCRKCTARASQTCTNL